MKHFIGIVPPEDIFDTILNLQQQFGDNRLEPHITLRPPIAPINLDAWIENIGRIATAFPSFKIQLPGTGYFGKRVLFIQVQSVELNALHHQITTAIKPFEPAEKEDDRPYHPHLTLGRNWCGFTKSDFEEMQKIADQYLSKEVVEFAVKFLRVYHKPGNSKRYEKMVDIPLR